MTPLESLTASLRRWLGAKNGKEKELVGGYRIH